MQLSERFLNLLQQQLGSFEAEPAIANLVVYVAQSGDGQAPSLEAIGQWPKAVSSLPPVESDPALRAPSPDRRWYPLQEGTILLGVLRAERFESNQAWPESLDHRLQLTAAALAQFLGMELERSRLFDELTQQREQISLMVHQLRNPLAALRTYAKLLMRKLGPESTHQPLLDGLLTEQDQLNKYISALDQLSQVKLPPPDISTSPLLLPPVNPKASCLSIRALLEPLIDRASATANFQDRKWFGPLDWPTWVDLPRPLEVGAVAEIVANLLENAFRYSSPKSSIGLHLSKEGLCVWDGGSPIPKEEREEIFQKGMRGTSSLELAGSGLGLALGRQLAEQLGSQLQLIIPPKNFDRVLPDQGNAFVLTPPIKALPMKEE